MTTFLQYHFLTSYAASNLNRDDAGRPKTLTYGGTNRLRVSSQSLKRAWRTSDLFATNMEGRIGTRSNRFSQELFAALTKRGVAEKDAIERIQAVLENEKIGKLKKSSQGQEDTAEHLRTEQLVHLGPKEREAMMGLADKLAANDLKLAKNELVILSRDHGAVDVALFGRMLADQTRMNVDASCQVAHAFTTHRAAVEDDFYTAVDDLKVEAETASRASGEFDPRGSDAGAGFIGVHDYGAGVFYHYVCLSADGLVANLGGDTGLATEAAKTLAETMCLIGPSGKQNSYASRTRAAYCLLEVGSAQPRSLAEAFVGGLPGGPSDFIAKSISALTTRRDAIDDIYGDAADDTAHFDVGAGEGSLADILALTGRAFERLETGA